MKRTSCIILCLLGFMALLSCEKEDALTPTSYERDWMIIEKPTNGDPVDELRYEIYEKYKVSTYYNDTIGQEERTDVLDVPYSYYEILKVYYSPGSQKPDGYFDLLKNHDVLLTVLEVFRDYVIVKFAQPEKLGAFLFVDSLWNRKQLNVRRQLNVYVGYNTTVVRYPSELKKWDEVEKQEFSNRFLVEYIASRLMSGKQDEWAKDFWKLSQDMNPDHPNWVYSRDVTEPVELMLAFMGTDFTRVEQLGFIVIMQGIRYDGTTVDAVPTGELDIQSYVDAVLNQTVEEFEERYADYSLVKKKFHLARDKVIELFQFELPG